MKKLMAVLMAVVMLMCMLPATALGETYVASTPIYNCSTEQLNNIKLASDAVNGWYIPCGAMFSFNDAVGPRSKEYGYVDATNGRGSHVMGGGVAQVAATIYLALLQMPGIQYDQITTYGSRYNQDYVSDGSLAVVTDYAAAVDFAFTNNYNDMAIRCWNDGVYLYCEISTGYYDYGYDYSTGGELMNCAEFRISGSSGLINNITRAANSIDGIVLHTGDVFSFNDIVGPRTEAYGYVYAVNGRGVNVVGGGVAQVASVVWLAVKDMDNMTVIEKSTYGERYNQDYVYSSSDAIVTDYNAGTDFAFRYDGPGSVVVYVYVDGNYLCCDIYDNDYNGGSAGFDGYYDNGYNGGSGNGSNGNNGSNGSGGIGGGLSW